MSTTTFVNSITCLKGRPKADQALSLLQRIATLVKPIMRKHNWVLPLLAEFFPKSDNLLGMNVNGGQKILIRLRPAGAPDTFYDEEYLLGTMLHELTHNVHGPHDSKFYQFLSKLEQEYYDLKQSGYSGEGFFSEGKRLGAGISHNIPMHAAKQKALEAAEKRRRTAAVLGGGGRLGGKSGLKDKSLRELAAEAAERRAQDEKTCGTLHKEDMREEVAAVEDSSATNVVEANREPSASTTQNKKRPRSLSTASIEALSKKESKLSSKGRPAVTAKPQATVKMESDAKPDSWICRTCTLINEPLALQCTVCLSLRPQDLNSTWICLNCGEDKTSQQFWTCVGCGELRLDV